jgi:hypothetical protein
LQAAWGYFLHGGIAAKTTVKSDDASAEGHGDEVELETTPLKTVELETTLAAVPHVPHVPHVPPQKKQPYPWRNDSANIALTAKWNQYLAATPFSDDVSGAISDQPPIALDWSLGTDHPTRAEKDGIGCWIGDEFVIAGGLWEPLKDNGRYVGGRKPPKPKPINEAWAYNAQHDSWAQLPSPPFLQSRGTGTCTADSLVLTGGRTEPPEGLTVARLQKQASGWKWETLTPMPHASYRWLGAAGVCGDWLVVAAGTNSSKFQSSDRFLREGGTPNDLPVTLPGFRLSLTTHSAKWEPIAPFPGGGLDAPNTAVVNGSLYVLGGWRGSKGGMEAWSELTGMALPVPILLGTNGGKLLRMCWKYDPSTDKWTALPDAPMHIERGGTVVLHGRYLISLGSTHGRNSFRVGQDLSTAETGDFSLGGGILGYYGADVLAFDTVELKWSRVGVMLAEGESVIKCPSPLNTCSKIDTIIAVVENVQMSIST